MEQEGIDFHHMVSEGYRKVLSGRPEVMKIDGGRSIDTIQKKIRNHVDELLKQKAHCHGAALNRKSEPLY